MILIQFLAPTLAVDPKRILIVGTTDLARTIGQHIYAKADKALTLIGFLGDDAKRVGESLVNPRIIGTYEDIEEIVGRENINIVVVATEDRRGKLPMLSLLRCKLKGVRIEEGATFFERVEGKIPVSQLKPSWMIFSDGFESLGSRMITKRIVDLLVSTIGLIAALPIMLLVAMLIRLESRGPVIFRQTRVGQHGKEFNIYKFRSMYEDAEAKSGPVWADADDPRVTRVGSIIRKTRLDELPQLLNILRGDMSFVGPRPERPYFVEQLRQKIPYYDIRLVVKPGLTGWAQVRYAYGASEEDALEKLQYDIFYIKNLSFSLDMSIILATVQIVLTGKGAR